MSNKILGLLLSFIFLMPIRGNSADFPHYLTGISKSYLCEKNAGVTPVDLSISASLRFLANGNEKKANDLTKSNARISMLTRHDELCTSDEIKSAYDYVIRLFGACDNTCRGTADCQRVCNTARDVLLAYLEGVYSGKGMKAPREAPPTSLGTK
jgi:hypothetical protein